MTSVDWLKLGSGALAVLAAITVPVLWRRSSPSSTPADSLAQPKQPDAETLSAAELAVLDDARLIDLLGVRGDLAAMQDSLGLSADNFARDALPVIAKVAAFVQQLPASECHHHANPGGLLQHVLDVARRALAIRAGLELPRGCSPEERSRRKHRWSYGVFLAALLHDIGKPAADVRVTYRRAGSRDELDWQPLAGSLLDVNAIAYRVQFKPPGERDYEAHERLGAVLMQRCVPATALAWLSEDSELTAALYGMLSGDRERGGALAEIVTRADRESTAHNLAHGSRARFATAASVPLIELLMAALRHLLSNHDGVSVPLNVSGGAAFVDDEHVWLVVPRVVDLVLDEVKRREPARGLPTDRTRIFDTFKEYAAIVPRADGRTVWKIMVRGEAPHFTTPFRHELSALKFHRHLLYRSPPENFKGVIDVVSDAGSLDATIVPLEVAQVEATQPIVPIAEPSPRATSALAQTRPPVPTEATIQLDMLPPVAATKPHVDATLSVGAPAPALPGVEPTTAAAVVVTATHLAPPARGTRLPSPGSAEVMATKATPPAVPPGEPTPVVNAPSSALAALDAMLGIANASTPHADAGGPPRSPPKPPLQQTSSVDFADDLIAEDPRHPDLASVVGPPGLRPDEILAPVSVPHPTRLPSHEGATIGPLATGFVRWLQEGLATRAIECNGANAFVHTLPEGLGLVSPRTFQVFAASLSGEIQPGHRLPKELSAAVITTVSKLQSELKKAKLVRKNDQKANSDYFHAYLSTASNKRINMMLLQEPERFFSSLPPANRALERAPVQTLEVK